MTIPETKSGSTTPSFSFGSTQQQKPTAATTTSDSTNKPTPSFGFGTKTPTLVPASGETTSTPTKEQGSTEKSGKLFFFSYLPYPCIYTDNEKTHDVFIDV